MRTGLWISLLAMALPAFAQTPAGVDIAWKVLPRRVVADNFGSRIAKLYYAVVAVVGNTSGYDVQVSSILFQLPQTSGFGAPIPADPYRIVRGSLEREHQVGIRNTTIGIVKGAGPILAGGAVFYTNGLHYTRLINLITNPFEKGLEMVFPDKTLTQMSALDTTMLRDTAIVGNNNQQVLLVFVSRGILAVKTSRFKAEFDPREVMRALGDLVLVGKSITYVNRISVNASRPR